MVVLAKYGEFPGQLSKYQLAKRMVLQILISAFLRSKENITIFHIYQNGIQGFSLVSELKKGIFLSSRVKCILMLLVG
jgi:hypothetical protein